MNSLIVEKNRESSLDALRGIAALFVVISHTTIAGLYKVEPVWGVLKWTPLRVFWSGHQAVILFFVLSGFALARLWQSINPRRIDAYLASRVVRLFPPYIASILLALAVYHGASLFIEWDRGWMNLPKPAINVQSLIGHVLMVGQFNTNEINPPIWSIVHEMRISIVFPAIYILVARFGGRALSAFCVLSAWIAWALLGNIRLNDSQINLLLTLHYSTFFAAGSLLALRQDQFARRFEKIAGQKRLLLWIVAALVYAYPFDNPWNLGWRAFGDLATGFGSILIIGLALTERTAILGKVGGFLGKISYSLYLNHMLALNLALLILYKGAGAPVVWGATIIGAVLLASFMNRWVEQPSITAARYLRAKLSDFRMVSQFKNG